MAQINIRVTDEQKALINKLAKENEKSISAYIIDKICIESVYQDDSERIEEDNKPNEELVSLLIKQIEQKDIQIEQLHKIIYNKDTKLLEYDSKKTWWKFW
ncbi:plasmid mobilization protein [Streptococcus pluranimalium]|uniref:plasmid mobilization protein n=1 Tax=Streptococcus pluranimalium TaxID=82348 RepID=UPI003BF86348